MFVYGYDFDGFPSSDLFEECVECQLIKNPFYNWMRISMVKF